MTDVTDLYRLAKDIVSGDLEQDDQRAYDLANGFIALVEANQS